MAQKNTLDQALATQAILVGKINSVLVIRTVEYKELAVKCFETKMQEK